MIYPIIAIMAGLIGTIANTYKKRWCFLLWIPANLFWIIYNLSKNEFIMSAVFSIYFTFAIIGWFTWKTE
jgi:nicotinamide riboside transporter PnuC